MESKPTYDELVLKVKELENKAAESLKVEISLMESEERLKVSEARSRTWLEHSPVCTKIVDLDFNLQYMSSAGMKSLHVDDITPFYGKPYPFDFYPESFKKPMTSNLEKVKSTGEVITQEASVVDIDGNELWFHSTLVPVKDDEGRIDYIIVVSLDTTERKKAEDGLRDSEEKFRLLLNSTAEAIYGLDIKGNCIFCNPACVEILGYERETDFLGKNMHELIHHTRLDGTESPEKECKVYMPFLRGEGVHVDDEVFWRADGSHFDTEYSAYPIRKGEEVIGSVVTFHDISERKKAQTNLIEAKKSAEEASAAKSDFLASISHEIRTPITVFMGAIEHLLEIDKDPKCQEVLDLAHISSKRLYVLLNEILDHSRLESRQMDLEEETFKVRRCLNETIEMMNDRAQKKHLKLALDVSPSVPEYMLGDPYRLGQILLNLVGNAIKFTEEGEVTVKVTCHDDYLKFNVSDTGIGISEDKLEDIFESFRQVDSSSTRSHGGVGLGLAISKGLTELMGGGIGVHSELGQGSVFSFTLPLKSMKK